eukprot:gene9010-1109_t
MQIKRTSKKKNLCTIDSKFTFGAPTSVSPSTSSFDFDSLPKQETRSKSIDHIKTGFKNELHHHEKRGSIPETAQTLLDILRDYSELEDDNIGSPNTIKWNHKMLLHRSGSISLEKQSLSTKLDNFSSVVNSNNNKELSVVICTFNVAEGTSESIGPWVASHDADIYAIGLQEVDMSAKAFISSTTIKNWDDHFTKSFESQYFKGYKKVASEQFVGMYHAIYIHKEHYKNLSNVYWSKLGVGALGMGNKGAIGFRFDLHSLSFCFINSHFVCSQSKVLERNQNYEQILNDDLFSNLNFKPTGHDYLFFFGDFNYRINLNRHQTFKNIEDGNIKNLLKNDQLNIEKEKKKIFIGFEEGVIKFPPTYKFNKNSKEYDTSKKQRIPSYCDRILVRSIHRKVDISSYKAKMNELTSDHRPVLALMKLNSNL